MIGTIGSLVQKTSTRLCWLVSASLYTLASLSTSLLLGALLGAGGNPVQHLVCGLAVCQAFVPVRISLMGILAVAYALGDAGVTWVPRPTLMQAVPVTWWRCWQPYGAALAFGAALGLGLTTRIAFGAFYVLCAWCFLKANVTYGALLMGTYGGSRALVIFPASWGLYCQRTSIQAWLAGPLFDQRRAQRIVASALIMFGALVLVSALLAPAHLIPA